MATIKMLPPAPEHAAFHGPYEDIPALSERISALIPEGLTFAQAILFNSPLTEEQRQELWRLNECIIVRRWYAEHPESADEAYEDTPEGGPLHAGGVALPIPQCPCITEQGAAVSEESGVAVFDGRVILDGVELHEVPK